MEQISYWKQGEDDGGQEWEMGGGCQIFYNFLGEGRGGLHILKPGGSTEAEPAVKLNEE